MHRLNLVAEYLSKALLVIGGAAMVVMMLHICADIASKYLFQQPINGTLEIVAYYYMILCVFLPIAYVQLRRQNLMVELFTIGMSDRKTAFLDGIVALASIAYVGLLTWLVLGEALTATRNGEMRDVTYFDMPVWPVRWVLPLSFGLMCFVFLMQAINDIRFGLTGRGTPTLEVARSQALPVE